MSTEQSPQALDVQKEPETLLEAIKQANVAAVQRFLARKKADIKQRIAGNSLLKIAAQKCEPEGLLIVSALLKAKASVKETSSPVSVSPLWQAVSLGRLGIVQNLLAAKADPNDGHKRPRAQDLENEENPVKTPLDVALSLNDSKAVKLLLKAKANIGRKSLRIASILGNLETVNLLLQSKAVVKTNLHNEVVMAGHADVIKALLDAKATMNWNSWVVSPLVIALTQNKYEVAQVLMMAKASVTAVDEWGRSCLDMIMIDHAHKLADFLPLVPSEHRPTLEHWYHACRTKISEFSSKFSALLLRTESFDSAAFANNLRALLRAAPLDYADLAKLLLFAKQRKVSEQIIDIIEKILDLKRGLVFCAGFWQPKKSAKFPKAVETSKPADDKFRPTYNRSLFTVIQELDCGAVKALLEENADPNDTEVGLAPLYLAASHYDREALPIVSALLAAKAEVKAVMPYGETALWAALRRGSVCVLGALLKAGANPNQTGLNPMAVLGRAALTNVNQTALSYACAANYAGSVRKLLEYNAVIHPEAIKLGVREGHVEVVKALLDHKAHIKGSNLVHSAIVNGRERIVQALIAAKADLEETDVRGRTPLLLAASTGSCSMVDMLLEAVASHEKVDLSGKTALHLAVQDGNLQKISRLLEANVNIDAVSLEGLTALQHAISKKPPSPQLVSVLVIAKAKVGDVKGCKRSALEIAQQDNVHQKVIDKLRHPWQPLVTASPCAVRRTARPAPDKKSGPAASAPAATAVATSTVGGNILPQVQRRALFDRGLLRQIGSASGFSPALPQRQDEFELTSSVKSMPS